MMDDLILELIFGGMAGLAALVSLATTIASLRLVLFGRRAPGVVVDAVCDETDDGHWHSLIELRAEDGSVVRVRGREQLRREADVARGVRLEMIHPQGRPDRAVERSFRGLALLPLAFLGVAALMLVMGWIKTQR